jgi:carbonic anhydrase/acetyltransferase-like protein (isoleucine patch superfamily)
MLIEHLGEKPTVDPSARIAPNAVICGDVTIGANTSIGFGAVLTAETGPIHIGTNCVIMENAVLRGTKRHPLIIGDHVLIGPRAYLTGCTVEDCAFLATGCAVFNGAAIGAGAELRINGTVHILTRLPRTRPCRSAGSPWATRRVFYRLSATRRSGRFRKPSSSRKSSSASIGHLGERPAYRT